MIREVIRPQHTSITIKIPTSYIGRKVEFILFPLDEEENDKGVKHSQKSLRGVFNQYADNAKLALENTAWQNHVMGKFKQND